MPVVFKCVVPSCGEEYADPALDDAPTHSRRCDLVLAAGWATVWIKVYRDQPIERDSLFASGAWLCPACQRRYLPQARARA